MRLMSHVRQHPKTGIYWYRRVVPDELRPFVPPVEGFTDKPNRREFSKTLQTRAKGDANRAAAALDKLVQSALEEARQRSGSSDLTGPCRPLSPQPLRRADVLAAVERWSRRQAELAELRLFNGDPALASWEEAVQVTDGRYHLQQFISSTRANPDLWQRIPAFDDVLLHALASEGVSLTKEHPALGHLRADFAAAWHDLLRKVDDMRLGRWGWDDKADEEDPSTTSRAVSASVEPPKHKGKPHTPFLQHVEDWKSVLPYNDRHINMYMSDVRAFAAGNPSVSVEGIRKAHVQRWADDLIGSGLTPKTINRKLAALRQYWQYLQSREVADADLEPFRKLYIKESNKKPSERRLRRGESEFSSKEVVSIWQAAQERGWDDMADAIHLAALTGARIESICQLKVGDIRTDQETGIRFLYFNDKTEAGERHVPIHSALQPVLERLVHSTRDGYLIPSTAQNKYNERSAPLSKRFSRLRTELGFSQAYVFHSIRKTVSTLFERSNCPENVAADVLGHRKPTMTYGTYSGGTALDQRLHWIEKALRYRDEAFMGAS